jgi:uncharacterized protein YbaR (Trm112 family)
MKRQAIQNECPECKKEMDVIKSIDFDYKRNGDRGNEKTYLYCKECKISKL